MTQLDMKIDEIDRKINLLKSQVMQEKEIDKINQLNSEIGQLTKERLDLLYQKQTEIKEQQSQLQSGMDGGMNLSQFKEIFGGGTTPTGGETGAGTTAPATTGGTEIVASGGEIGGAGSSGSGGLGALGTAGIVAAAIAAQHGLSNQTDTEFEGVKTDDAFGGHFGTEPWLGFVHDKLGWEPTEGEKFDAAVDNKDWGLALERTPAMLDYWSDPARSWGHGAAKNIFGEEVAGILSPLDYIVELF